MRPNALRNSFKMLAACALVVLPATSLMGCGFTPLYAQQGITANMAQVDIKVPQTRTGYFVEQDLRGALGSDLTSPKAYTLSISLKERHYSIGYRVDDTSTRSENTTAVRYVLKDAATGTVLYKSNFSETVTYDTSKSPFAGVISQQDAQKRVATGISQKIQTELALYFHGDLIYKPTPQDAASSSSDDFDSDSSTSVSAASPTSDTVPAAQ